MKKQAGIIKKKVVEFPVTRRAFVIIMTNDVEKTYNNVKESFARDLGFPAYGLVASIRKITGSPYPSPKYDNAIFLQPDSTINTIAHECYHAIKSMERGIHNMDGGEEWFAYHLGYLTQQCYDFIYSNKRGK